MTLIALAAAFAVGMILGRSADTPLCRETKMRDTKTTPRPLYPR